MKIERTKNAARNIVFGVIQKFYMIAFPFLMRTLMIYFMGVQYLGLNSLFTSILQVLNLAELGVGNAMVYSMYRPIVDDDSFTICALMRLYRIYYRLIGAVIAIVGCCLIPVIPYLIKADSLAALPKELNIYVLYILNLATTVFTYWLFAYKNCLLNAHQRTDVISKITIVVMTGQYFVQIIAVCFLRNYYVYLIAALLMQIITNIATAIIVSKMYPDYVPAGQLPKEKIKDTNQRIKDLFTSKVGGVVAYSADSIVISAFLGLSVLAIYQNYYFIITSISGFIAVITGACIAGIGNSFVVESKEKNYADLRKFSFIIMWILTFCCCCFLNLFQPFMKIWVGEKLMFPFSIVILFCIYFFVFELNAFLSVFKDASGRWHEDRFRPLITACCNLTLNLMTVKKLGVYGVLASTFVVQICISIPWLCRNLFSTVYEKKHMKQYLFRLLQYGIIAVICCVSTHLACSLVHISNNWLMLFVCLIITVLISNSLLLLINIRRRELKESITIVRRILKR